MEAAVIILPNLTVTGLQEGAGVHMNDQFDKMTDRSDTGSMKWDVQEQELPMWVADMDFETAPEITAAITKRANHGIFGYSVVTPEWYDAYIGWWERRHAFAIEKEWLVFCTGVVPAISSIVRKLTTPGENIVVQTPVYNIFFNSVTNNGRNILQNRLKYDGNDYYMNFVDLEDKLSDPQTSMMLLCNPHNPVGKIWDADTLARIGELCRKHHVLVVSDEIHCDLTMPGAEYIPFASVSEACRSNSITCLAPTKAFNLAGIQTAAVMIPDANLCHKVWRGLNTDEAAEPSAFAIPAAVAAFTKGASWLDALCSYLADNRSFAQEYLRTHLPQIHAVDAQATYLLWLDCGRIIGDAAQMAAFIRRDSGLYLSAGSEYGDGGRTFLRMNIACPRARLLDGLKRLCRSVESYEAWAAQLC